MLSAVVTDKEMAIINACCQVLPATVWLLCLWHVEKNVLVHAVQKFVNKDQGAKFIKV